MHIPTLATYPECEFLDRFYIFNVQFGPLGEVTSQEYRSSIFQIWSNAGEIEFQHRVLVGIFIAFAVENANLLSSFAAHFSNVLAQERLEDIQTPRYL